MDWYILRQRLLAAHSLDPRVSYYIDMALGDAKRAIELLAQHGHQFHLAPGPEPAREAFPRMVFHVDCPRGRKVWSQFEIIELGDEWYDTLDEAQRSHGLKVQIAGRGGIGSRALPVLVLDAPQASKLTRGDREPEQEIK